MAEVVMVHGAFNELWGPHSIRARWLPALRDGLWHHGVEIADDQVAVCFYGDLFRSDPDAPDEAFTRTRPGVHDLLSGMVDEELLGALGTVAGRTTFERTVDLVTRMSSTPGLRRAALVRLEALVGPETRVIVAHSLGTVLAYAALRHRTDWSVDTFVTLGSPLGDASVHGLLVPPVAAGEPEAWPTGLRRWVDVTALDDVVARRDLGPVFGDRVERFRVDNGHRAHDPEPYLNAAVTGAAVAAALTGT